MSGTWGEFLRLRGRLHAVEGRATDAYHDFGQSVSVFELLGERYQAGLSYLELGRLAAVCRRALARHALPDRRAAAFRVARRGAGSRRYRDRAQAKSRPPRPAATSACRSTATTRWCGGLWMPSVMPALLAREGATALLEACDAQARWSSCRPASGQLKRARVAAGCDADARPSARRRGDAAPRAGTAPGCIVEPLGRERRRAALRRGFERAADQRGRDRPAFPDALRRAAAGVRSLRGARAAGRSRADGPRAAARAAAARLRLRQCRRCSAWPTRFSACRATT